MYKINLFTVRALKKIKMLKFFNFTSSFVYRNKGVKIPFMLGSGLPNFILEIDWLDQLISQFVEEDKKFIDVGVNIGQTLIKYKTLFPNGKYVGFEPNSICVSYVNKLININGFESSSVYNLALSNNIQVLSLEKTSETDPRASVVENLRANFFEKKEPVLGVDYDYLFLEDAISFVKIDVEGGELEVITGMKNSLEKHRPLITCEVLDSNSSSEFEFTQNRASELSKLLKSIDYKIIRFHTKENKIIGFEQIPEIKIVQWTIESLYLNDYLFYPIEKEEYVLEVLNKIV